MSEQPALLKVSGLKKNFHTASDTICVLDGVDLELQEGEFLAVVGESGSGKSTLLHVMGTLEPSGGGDVFLNGEALFQMSSIQTAQARNRNIGFVYQAHHLIPELDALENVMLPLFIRGESRTNAMVRAEQLLDRLGLSKRKHHRPGRMSGGEAQRVAVARALVGKPRLLLADEPTGNLDEHTASEVFDLMQQLCKEEGTAVVMVTHSIRFARLSDRILRLHEGKLEAYAP